MKVLVAIEDRVFGEVLADFIIHHQWPPLTKFKVLHVIEPLQPDTITDIAFMSFLEDVSKEAERKAAALVRRVGLIIRSALKSPHIEESVGHGFAKEEILATAKEWKADLIIVGSQRQNRIERIILGSVSTAVLEQAPCQVLIMRMPVKKQAEKKAKELVGSVKSLKKRK